MLKKQHLPYIFLLIMIMILIFIAGVKYGGKVEETNKTIRYVLSMTPTQKPTLTSPPATPTETRLGFTNFSAPLCGVQFLIPDNLKEKQKNTIPLGTYEFVDASNRTKIRVWCTPLESAIPFFPFPYETLDTSAEASSSVKIGKLTTVAIRLKDSRDSIAFVAKHPVVKNVGVLIDESLLPLFQSSFEIIKATPAGSTPDAIITP